MVLDHSRSFSIILDQEEKALVSELFELGNFATFVPPSLHFKRVEFFEGLAEGDSGNPEFLIIKIPNAEHETLVLLSTATSTLPGNSAGVGTFARPDRHDTDTHRLVGLR